MNKCWQCRFRVLRYADGKEYYTCAVYGSIFYPIGFCPSYVQK